MNFVKKLELFGVMEFSLNEYIDNRGSFIKLFYQPSLEELGIDFSTKECYVSNSKKRNNKGDAFAKKTKRHSENCYMYKGFCYRCTIGFKTKFPYLFEIYKYRS